eukprot:175152-Chlamydomonas_euryale.AAC.1
MAADRRSRTAALRALHAVEGGAMDSEGAARRVPLTHVARIPVPAEIGALNMPTGEQHTVLTVILCINGKVR